MPSIIFLAAWLALCDSAPGRPVLPLVSLAESAAIDCASPPARDGHTPEEREGDSRHLWRLDGVLAKLDPGAHTLEVNGVALWVEDGTVILLDCRPARFRDLRRGSTVKVVYEERRGRNVVTVMEADGEEH